MNALSNYFRVHQLREVIQYMQITSQFQSRRLYQDLLRFSFPRMSSLTSISKVKQTLRVLTVALSPLLLTWRPEISTVGLTMSWFFQISKYLKYQCSESKIGYIGMSDVNTFNCQRQQNAAYEWKLLSFFHMSVL